MIDKSNSTVCVKTGGQGFIIETDEYVYGDWFKTADGTLICNAIYRGTTPVKSRVNYQISDVSFWNPSPDLSGHATLVVDVDSYFDRGYEGDPIP